MNIIDIIKKTTRGEGVYWKVLYLWGLLPALLILYFQKSPVYMQSSKFTLFLIYLIITFYFLWHLFVLRNTLQTQPEYKVVKKSKKELYEGKTPEEIKEMKKQERKRTLRKFMLLEAWDTAPSYTIIACIDAFVALTQIQYLFQLHFIN